MRKGNMHRNLKLFGHSTCKSHQKGIQCVNIIKKKESHLLHSTVRSSPMYIRTCKFQVRSGKHHYSDTVSSNIRQCLKYKKNYYNVFYNSKHRWHLKHLIIFTYYVYFIIFSILSLYQTPDIIYLYHIVLRSNQVDRHR